MTDVSLSSSNARRFVVTNTGNFKRTLNGVLLKSYGICPEGTPKLFYLLKLTIVQTMLDLLDNVEMFFKRKKKKPANLAEALDNGLLTKEEFLRFAVVRKEIELKKAMDALTQFNAKPKKKKK